MSKLSMELDRLNALKSICPEFYYACKSMKFGKLRAENPALSIACTIYMATHNASPERLIQEITYYTLIKRYDIYAPDICKHLIRFFAESNEPECTMTLLRWMHENKYNTPEPETFRL